MRAWTFERYGAPGDVLSLTEVKRPAPRPGEVLVEVEAAAVNFADDLVVRGTYQSRPALPATPGMELAGRVVGRSLGGTGFVEGDRVVGLPRGLVGAFAEYAVVPAEDLFAAPPGLSGHQLAAFLVPYQTAWFALHRRAEVRKGEVVLVHAAAGGVGSATVQLAKAAGATVIGVVGSRQKSEVARNLGCDAVINRATEDIVARTKELTHGRGADVIIDPVGGAAFDASTRTIAFEGRMVIVGFASGQFPRVRAEHAMVKNYGVLGLHWGLYRERARQAVAEAHDALTELVSTGAVAPLVSAVHPFADAINALASVASGTSMGRVILSVPSAPKGEHAPDTGNK